MIRLRRWVSRTLLSLFALYIIYGAAMIALHPLLIYPFRDTAFSGQGYSAEQIEIAGSDPLTLYTGKEQRDGPVVLYFMGNAGAFEVFRPSLDYHRHQNRTVIAMGYRGGGGLAGKPSEKVLKQDALVAFDVIRNRYPGHKIVLHGYSLGTGLAMHVGARRDVSGIVLGAPYAQLCALMQKASALPACWMPVQRWNTLADVGKLRAPVLIVHGTQDQLIPFASGQQLADAMREAGVDVKLVPIPDAGHTTLKRSRLYQPAINRFVQNL